MTRFLTLFVATRVISILLSSGVSLLDETSTKPPLHTPPVLLPTTPVLVEPELLPDTPPKPKPTSELITTVYSDEWYLIETIDKSIILDSPEGLVKIREYDVSTIPHTFVGKLSDGNGTPDEERTCPTDKNYKHVYSIRVVNSGIVELQIGKSGTISRDGFQRIKLNAIKTTIKPPPTINTRRASRSCVSQARYSC